MEVVWLKKSDMVQLISLGGLLTALTVLLQSAPVYLPTIGMALSPLSTLPIALAAVWNIYLGIGVMISSAFILFIINPQETVILLFTTGLLGILLGTLLFRRRVLVTILTSTLGLTLGMLALTYIIAIPAFVDLAFSFSISIIIMLFMLFSFIYTMIWIFLLRRIYSRIKKLKLSE